MNELAENAAKHLIRGTDFFFKRNYEDYGKFMTSEMKEKLTDADIKCIGFGLFNKEQILDNFFTYVKDLLENPPTRLKSLKLTISGFDIMEKQSR